MIKKIIKILLVVIWMGVIFSFSSDNKNASDNKSRSVIITIYHFFNNKELSKQEEKQIIEKYAYPIRKLAHFTEYFILGLLVISLISEYIMISRKAIIIGIIICLLYAVSDELHQLFTSGRSARVFDVLVDTLGSTVAIFIYTFIKNIFLRRKKYE